MCLQHLERCELNLEAGSPGNPHRLMADGSGPGVRQKPELGEGCDPTHQGTRRKSGGGAKGTGQQFSLGSSSTVRYMHDTTVRSGALKSSTGTPKEWSQRPVLLGYVCDPSRVQPRQAWSVDPFLLVNDPARSSWRSFGFSR